MKEVRISLEEIIEGTGKSREVVLKTMKELEEKKVVDGDAETGWALRSDFLLSLFAVSRFDDSHH